MTAASLGALRPRARAAGELWLLGACVVTIGAAWWIRSPSPELLLGLTAAVVGLAVLLLRGRRVAVGRRLAFALAALSFVVAAGWEEWQQATLRRNGEAVRAVAGQAAAEALAAAVRAEGAQLDRLADAALDVPENSQAAFLALSGLVPSAGGRALVLARNGVPVAWSGRLLLNLDSLPARKGLIATPFYLVAYAVQERGARTAVATSVIHAEPPADALVDALAERIAADAKAAGFVYAAPEAAGRVADAALLRVDSLPLLAVRAVMPSVEALQAARWERALPWVGASLAAMLLCLLAMAWRRDLGLRPRFFALAAALAVPTLLPLSVFSNLSTWFDPTFYLVRSGGPYTANAAALALTAALLLLALLTLRRARGRLMTRGQGILAVIVVAGLGPFLLRELASGVQMPVVGASVGLWLSWQITVFLASVTVLLLGVSAGQSALGRDRGLPLWSAPALAVVASVLAPLLLEAPGRFPQAYTALWAAAIVALAVTRRGRAIVISVALVAASGATTLTWFSAVRERVSLAVRDVQGLDRPDTDRAVLLDRFTEALDPMRAARTRVELLAQLAATELARAEYPTEIATWGRDGNLLAELTVGRAAGVTPGVNLVAAEAQQRQTPILSEVQGNPGLHLILALPHADGSATTVVVAPRSRLVAQDPFGAFLGFSPPPTPEPPYVLRIGEGSAADVGAPMGTRGAWARFGNELHGDWQLPSAGDMPRRLHAVVELRGVGALVTRGVLLVLVDLAVLGAIWLLIVMAEGVLQRWWRQRRRELLGSYRVRLSAALFACFLVPSLLFGLWSWRRIQADDVQARDLLVRETLRAVGASTESVDLVEAAARFETPLLLYARGTLIGTSDPLLEALAPVGLLLPPEIVLAFADREETTAGRAEVVGTASVRLGYRSATDSSGVQYVLAAPARLDDRLLDRRRNDLAVFLLFALALGALAALWASGAASRQLSRPIRELRDAALALARGSETPPLRDDPPEEFDPVFRAFRRMTSDLAESREALETAERRLAATLRSVASGVLAVDEADRLTFANPMAEQLLGVALPVGRPLPAEARALVGDRLAELRAGATDDAAFETEYRGRRLSTRLTRISPTSRRAVVTLEDVTDVTRAERVLAWGEMARQVAHEIKNPLTPMRLGMQHLRRARHDARVDFDRVLEENTTRILAEIDRLDEIARAFSRYGTAPERDLPPESVDVASVARDVLELERMGQAEIAWVAEVPDAPVLAAARARELREVLLNLLENARLAGATRVTLRVLPDDGGARLEVRDNGSGIPDALLTRIFDPHFSTRTSGSGLGLAISRRLIDGWGGSIAAAHGSEGGAVLTVRLAPPPVG
ncbi:ATP-binding protein [Pseudogemmatithrix spongiicola]|uniref:histidine kinase n=1 Tax=Pseudogemmatithrix spongiicola TaxID=3062599 RepID=A0AA49K3D7_9BACT|nr:ATP-binding protein [Gemmatimonadaceae bacterium 'strain 138']WKW16563.1 ATP-binding protein [Gemmatimonadaceae bacterium 'strain 318']